MKGEIRMGRLTPEVGPEDHSQGPMEAPVALVKYGDYECPYCGQVYPIIKEIQKRLGRSLHFVFRNFPLTIPHPHAQHAAEAPEAAAAQGKFWEMHDFLYEHQKALDDDSLVKYAAELGLDMERFRKEMAAQKYAERVRRDFQSGVRSGVNGTPTFFINGVRHDASFDLKTLLGSINKALKEPKGHGALDRVSTEKQRGI